MDIMLNTAAVARGMGVASQNLLRDHPDLTSADKYLPGTKEDNHGAPLWHPETITAYCAKHGLSFDIRKTFR